MPSDRERVLIGLMLGGVSKAAPRAGLGNACLKDATVLRALFAGPTRRSPPALLFMMVISSDLWQLWATRPENETNAVQQGVLMLGTRGRALQIFERMLP